MCECRRGCAGCVCVSADGDVLGVCVIYVCSVCYIQYVYNVCVCADGDVLGACVCN